MWPSMCRDVNLCFIVKATARWTLRSSWPSWDQNFSLLRPEKVSWEAPSTPSSGRYCNCTNTTLVSRASVNHVCVTLLVLHVYVTSICVTCQSDVTLCDTFFCVTPLVWRFLLLDIFCVTLLCSTSSLSCVKHVQCMSNFVILKHFYVNCMSETLTPH